MPITSYLDENSENCEAIRVGDGLSGALVLALVPVNQVKLKNNFQFPNKILKVISYTPIIVWIVFSEINLMIESCKSCDKC